MSLTSLSFLLFFFAVFACYQLALARFRWVILLCASYLFYAALQVPYLLAGLLAVTANSYSAGILVQRASCSRARKAWMILGVSLNLAVLIFLKYVPFLLENLSVVTSILFSSTLPSATALVSIGVSFYVFQGIGYIVDVYLETTAPQRHLGRFALFLAFFPKLLQGPIERSSTLHPQLENLARPDRFDLQEGINLFLLGMFKKVVIADRLAGFVNPVYAIPYSHHGLTLVVATYLFALQIYFDFSGYSDMAVGIARCFRIRLTQNFEAPYLAKSTAEFWRRWHISFSGWILTFIFQPLQFHFRDWRMWGTPLALLLTFLISGLWHGASWCFITWGALHGVYLCCGIFWKKRQRALYRRLGLEKHPLIGWWQRIVTFNLVCFAWIFFRSGNFADALYIASSSIWELPQSVVSTFNSGRFGQAVLLGRTTEEVVWTAVAVAVPPLLSGLVRWVSRAGKAEQASVSACLPWWSQAFFYGIAVYVIAICGTAAQGFIYQQF